MTQKDASTSSQPHPLSQAHILDQECNTFSACNISGITTPASDSEDTQGDHNGKTAAPIFPVTGKVTFKPMTVAPQRGPWHLSPTVARLVSAVSLGAVLLGPLTSCSSTGDTNLPCPVPTSSTAATPMPDGTTTASCTTHSGTHYVWIRNRGGWVSSNDGVHPNAGVHGVGADSGHGGVGGGDHGGSGGGHGGGEGG